MALGVLVAMLVLATVGCDTSAPMRYRERVFEEVEVEPDIIYRQTVDWQGNDVDLRLDIYQPVGDTAEVRPAVMWMFGGYFVSGNRDEMRPYAQDSAQRGYVGVSIQYRTRPGMSPDDTEGVVAAAYDAYDDALAAVQWLKDNAARYRIDPRAIVAGRYSAGGYTAMHLGYLPGFRGPDTSPVAGVVSISANSFALPGDGDPPAVMMHGTSDELVPVSAAQLTCDTGRSVGSGCDWVPFEGESHTLVVTRVTDLQTITAAFIVYRVLAPLGYDVGPSPALPAGQPLRVAGGSG
jgi:acetyl esterase/lipase